MVGKINTQGNLNKMVETTVTSETKIETGEEGQIEEMAEIGAENSTVNTTTVVKQATRKKDVGPMDK